MKNSPTLSIVYAAIGAALIAVLSQITIPMGPVPFTLQTLAIGLIASLYKPKEAITSVAIYLALGAIGLPVFAGFSGGFQALFGPTAGFLWGFLAYAAITSTLTKSDSHPVLVFLANLLGDAACFALGIVFFQHITKSSWTDTLSLTTIPFLIPDLAKIILATLVQKLLQPALKHQDNFK